MIALLVFLCFGVCILLARDFFPAYYSEKGRNRATQEDIARITDQVERVKIDYAERMKTLEHQHSLLLEELKSRHQLRAAAIDKRLQVHQEAFTRWRDLMSKINSNDLGALAYECQQWSDRNCLYLSPLARESFIKAFLAAGLYPAIRQDGGSVKAREDLVKAITAAGDAIVAGAELPAMGETESQRVPVSAIE